MFPPISASDEPSTTFSQAAVPRTSLEHLFIGAWPSKTNPPHKPLENCVACPVTSSLPVMIIGADFVPLAINLEPLITIK